MFPDYEIFHGIADGGESKENQAVLDYFTPPQHSINKIPSLTCSLFFTKKIGAIRARPLHLLTPSLQSYASEAVPCVLSFCLMDEPSLLMLRPIPPFVLGPCHLCQLKDFVMLASVLCIISFYLFAGSFQSVCINIIYYPVCCLMPLIKYPSPGSFKFSITGRQGNVGFLVFAH